MTTNYLEIYDATAEDEKFALVYKWMWQEPLSFFKELREKRPILVTPKATIITRFADVTDVLNLPKIFTVALYLPKMGNGIYLMAHDDDALHTREKSMMQSLLNRDDLPAVRSMIANIAQNILAQANGKLEIVNQYCRMVPAGLVQDYFGLTGVDKAELIDWSYWNQYNTFHNQPFDLIPAEKKQFIEQQQNRVSKSLGIYIAELMARRKLAIALERADLWQALVCKLQILLRQLQGKKHEPLRDDIVTRMLRNHFAEAMDLDLKRLGVNAGGLLIGAIETTSQAVAQAIQFLLQHPDYLAQARTKAALADPAEFDGLIWEVLRFVPIAPYLFRQTAETYVVGQGQDYATTIPAQSYVLIATQSAMFDPAAFDHPDEIRAQRNWYHYFHFGFGSHECLGRYIGMVMIPEMVRHVVLQNNLAAVAPIDYKSGPFPEEYQLHWQ
ncbi:cytochrome P450 [Methylomonas paludis]|nr:cytochrome P450 [Methylomonas paludis]